MKYLRVKYFVVDLFCASSVKMAYKRQGSAMFDNRINISLVKPKNKKQTWLFDVCRSCRMSWRDR